METMTNYYLEEFAGQYFSCNAYQGVSFRVVGREITFDSEFVTICDEENCDHVEDYCYEEIISEIFTGKLIIVMVGDDKEYVVDSEDLEQINEEDFCHGCGQVGCGH